MGRFNIRITSNRYGEFNEACCLVTVCFVLRCRVVTSLHFISRSIKCRWSLRVLHLHISCSDMTKDIEKNVSIQSGISYTGKTASLLSNVPVVCIALSISCLHQTQTQTGVYSTLNYIRKFYIGLTLQNNTNILNKYEPGIIKKYLLGDLY